MFLASSGYIDYKLVRLHGAAEHAVPSGYVVLRS